MSEQAMKYSDQIAIWLRKLGYTHCFYVSGGNIMHLLESCSRVFRCVPFVHEVSAAIAAEYFNEANTKDSYDKERAFVLLTAGPGLTNAVTAFAGAFLESREMLVIGGQVKVSDLSRGTLRQRGIQEIDGVNIVRHVSVTSVLIDAPLNEEQFSAIAESGSRHRKGPVFMEVPLDVQGAPYLSSADADSRHSEVNSAGRTLEDLHVISEQIIERINASSRPVILIGGGISRYSIKVITGLLKECGVPLMTTWNGADRISEDFPLYFGRPNTWGQRSANIILQQATLVVALGTRLGLQQTGFNWEGFVPLGEIIQVDIDQSELEKGHPKISLPVCGDANVILTTIARHGLFEGKAEWVQFCRKVRRALPLNDSSNSTHDGYINPYQFCITLSALCSSESSIVPCSSGGANTVMMQSFMVKEGQTMFNDKGLASMGYGLAGAIGTSLAAPDNPTVLVEGDGGFAQNLQELGTVSRNNLNLKIFIFDNGGYASIRMTQSNYFKGDYIGCDISTGLGMPKWTSIFDAYEIPVVKLTPSFDTDSAFLSAFNSSGPTGFIVPIDPEQTYYPKIASRISATGGMESNPLHLMSPALEHGVAVQVMPYLLAENAGPDPD